METSFHIPCLYFAAGAGSAITEANALLCSLLGYTSEELIGKRVEMIFTVPTRIFQQTHLYPLLQMKGFAEEIYLTLQTKTGEYLPVLVNAQRKEAGATVTFHYAGIAIRQRNRYEEEIIAAKKAAEKALNENTALHQAKQELQQHAEKLDHQMQLAQKRNEELVRFNHVVTHDLQEPLRKLAIFTSMMQEAGSNEAKEKAAQKIGRVAEEMRLIVHGLQQYIWISDTTLKWEEVPLTPLFEAAAARIKAENPQLDIYINGVELPVVQANAEQMRFLFHELLLNAVRFRKQDAAVHISADACRLMRNKFRQLDGKYKYTEFLKLQLTDDGLGIDNAFKEQAFDLFRKLHPSGGRGVGLSLCRKIVENHGGSISLSTNKGEGTLVSILLPLQQDAPAGERAPQLKPNQNTLPNDQ